MPWSHLQHAQNELLAPKCNRQLLHHLDCLISRDRGRIQVSVRIRVARVVTVAVPLALPLQLSFHKVEKLWVLFHEPLAIGRVEHQHLAFGATTHLCELEHPLGAGGSSEAGTEVRMRTQTREHSRLS